MKKITIVLAIAVVLSLLYRCGVSDRPSYPSSVSDSSSSSSSNLSIPCPSIENAVLYDDETVTITVSGMEYNKSFMTYVVKMDIQNHSDQTISYYLNRVDVNGYTISALLAADIYGGMSADADFGFPINELKFAGIKNIQQITFTLTCLYDETDEIICEITPTLKTSDDGTYAETYEFLGDEVYSTEEYTVLVKPNSAPSIKHPIIIYVENNTDVPLIIMYDDIALNNKMVFTTMSGPYVLPHSHRVEEIMLTFFGEEPDIDKITSFTSGLSICPYRIDGSFSTGDTIEVPPFTVSFS